VDHLAVAQALSALDILAAPDRWSIGEPSLVVLHGSEPFLAAHALALLRDRLCPDEADRGWAWREFDGSADLDPRDVFDEAATIPMFGTATRVAVVRQADDFVSAARERLESLATAPRGRRGLVVLEVRGFPANTRLAKAVVKHGVVIETSVPARLDLAGWVAAWARSRHGIVVANAAAQRLLERLGGSLGQVDQALARLAAATPASARGNPLPPEAVDALAASPQERTAWGMIDAAATGDTPRALRELADLLAAGEHAIGVSAQVAAVLRRLSTATRLLALPAGSGRPANVEAALREAGVAAWPKALAQARESLVQLGARRARRLPLWLLELDLSLKGEASRGIRSRLALERLFCKMGRGGDGAAGDRARPAPRRPGARP